MWINGRDPSVDGWSITGLTNWMTVPGVDRATVSIPGIVGTLPAVMGAIGPRQMELTLEPTAALAAVTDRDGMVLDALKDRLRGLLWLRFDDAPTRVVRAVCTGLTVDPLESHTVFSVPTIRVRVMLTAYDPASYDTEPTVLELATTPRELTLGDLPSVAILRWGGAWSSSTSRTFTLRDAGGGARHVMTITTSSTGSLASTDHLEIDFVRRYLTKVEANGTRTNVADWYASSTWPVFDPAYQHRGETGATAEISAGTAQLTYRNAYGL